LVIDGKPYTYADLTAMHNAGTLSTLDGLPPDADLSGWRRMSACIEYPRIAAAMQFIEQIERGTRHILITVSIDEIHSQCEG
jgi:hypothetical protein